MCNVENCENDVHCKGMCQMHYRRFQRNGTTGLAEKKVRPGPKPDPSKPYSKSRPPKARKPAGSRTECPQGHPYLAETTYVNKHGYKQCKICRNERMAARRPAAGVGAGGLNAAKTHCPYGHEYSLENTTLDKNRHRVCKTCAAERSRLNRFHKYGMTEETFNALLDKQDGKCAICAQTMVNSKDIHIDHFHDTGQVRGILCKRCNVGIGFLNDSPALLIAAAEYLLAGESWRTSA